MNANWSTRVFSIWRLSSYFSPPLAKGGQGGFATAGAHACRLKSPSIPLFQRGRPGTIPIYRLALWQRIGVRAVCLLLFALPIRAEVIDKIIATIDGEPITAYELKQFGERTIRGRQVNSSDQSMLLDALITEKLVNKEVSDKGIVVRDEDVERYIDSIKERNKINDEQLQQALAQQGLTLASYRAQIREDIQRQQLIAREIRGKVNVTPEEVQRYYEAHLSEYSTPARLQVAHIVFRLEPDAAPDRVAAVMAKAEEVQDRIKKGADFAELAKQVSEDASAANGGALGWFKPGELLEPLEKAAQTLKPGQVSDPIRTKAGVHLIKLEAREEASHQNLDGLADQIKEKLYNAALEERFQKWLTDDLRKRHDVEIL
jgi:peptidyl-prolyl cis-trans isomerase SurA